MSLTSGREFTKTLLFVGIAVLTMFVAVSTRPKLNVDTNIGNDEVGIPLFAELVDTGSVTGLEVLSFDDEFGSLKPFKIEQERQGQWVIPSRERYPADAQDRVARAAAMFVDLKVLRVLSDQDAEHETFGVVEPKYGQTKIGDEGVGTLFKVTGRSGDNANATVAELIIGNPVKDLLGQYYVRRPGKSRVYQVEIDQAIDPSNLSTEFTDWIDRRLLPFNVENIANVTLRNYTTSIRNTPNGESGLNLAMSYIAELAESNPPTADDAPPATVLPEWTLESFEELRDGNIEKSALGQGEILNQSRVRELKNALRDVLISNVQRKPAALAAKARAGDREITTPESSTSLAKRGFYPVRAEEQGQLFANQGELWINTAGGVQFRLLFGGLAEQGNQSLSTTTTLTRFVLIEPWLNEAALPKPSLEPLPSVEDDMTENDRKNAVERITRGNDRKIEEYASRRNSVQQAVNALREKYADWYYLIAEDVVRKLRIPRSELITLSDEALSEGFGIEAFRKLQAEGLGK